MTWNDYLQKHVPKNTKNWITAFGVYFLFEIIGNLAYVLILSYIIASTLGVSMDLMGIFLTPGTIGLILNIALSIVLIKQKKRIFAQFLTVTHLFTLSTYFTQLDEYGTAYASFVIPQIIVVTIGLICAVTGWIILRKAEKTYQKSYTSIAIK